MKYLSSNEKKRIILFADNLDRCSSANIKQILDSICQFLKICTEHRSNLIAFFAMDKQIVINALQKEGVPAHKVDEYLDKIINLSIYPKMPDNIDNLIFRFFGEGSEETRLLQEYYFKNRYNPRKLSNLRYIDNIKYKIYNGENLTKEEIKEYFG